MPMICFVVTDVTRRKSSQISTLRFSYSEGKAPESKREYGAEWEEVEFRVEEEKQPPIQVANIIGSAFLNGTSKLILNNPELFGSFKVGDIIPFKALQKTKEETEK